MEVSAEEKGGIVYVMQEGEIIPEMLADNLHYFTSEQTMFRQGEVSEPTNWKLLTAPKICWRVIILSLCTRRPSTPFA
ncbi:MAG: hypothetical protein P8Q37_10135 [Porticoccaceae bacterium]|nr:hypothetical protein [Porticoccaceae bacterium]